MQSSDNTSLCTQIARFFQQRYEGVSAGLVQCPGIKSLRKLTDNIACGASRLAYVNSNLRLIFCGAESASVFQPSLPRVSLLTTELLR